MKTLTTETYKKHIDNIMEMDDVRSYNHTLENVASKRAIAKGEKSEKLLIKHGVLDNEGGAVTNTPKEKEKAAAITYLFTFM